MIVHFVDIGGIYYRKIKGAYGQFVKFSFINLDIIDNSDSPCEKSYISVFDVDLQDNINSLGKFCKANRPYEHTSIRRL
jgi:hypothetical protein